MLNGWALVCKTNVVSSILTPFSLFQKESNTKRRFHNFALLLLMNFTVSTGSCGTRLPAYYTKVDAL